LKDPATKTLFGFNPDYTFSMPSSEVYKSLSEDFMKSDCLARLEYVLTKLPVIIYNGQNDLIVPNPGTLRWVYNLNHPATKDFQAADFTPWKVGDKIVGYKKTAGNLEFRIVNQAGHLVPMDQPDNALDLVKSFVEAHKK
jgi:carboxypeptidase C (cathepsin A)